MSGSESDAYPWGNAWVGEGEGPMTHDRDTFLTAHELLNRAIDHSSKVEERLGQPGGLAPQSRAALLQSAFREAQNKLTTSLRRYAEEAQPSVLDTFAQASVPVPELLSLPSSPLTPDALTKWMLDVNRPLASLFSEAADAVEATPAHDVFDSLAALVRSHEMHIVQAADGASDL
jgi:hypothetical protein